MTKHLQSEKIKGAAIIHRSKGLKKIYMNILIFRVHSKDTDKYSDRIELHSKVSHWRIYINNCLVEMLSFSSQFQIFKHAGVGTHVSLN